MTSNRSLGVNPFFLKRQHEAAAKELANSGSNISISSKKFARNEEHSQKVPAQKSIPEVSTIDTGRVRPDPRLTTPTPPPSSAAPAPPAAAATLPCPALGPNHQLSHSHRPLRSTPRRAAAAAAPPSGGAAAAAAATTQVPRIRWRLHRRQNHARHSKGGI